MREMVIDRATAVGSGGDYSVSIQSGQTVALQSNVNLDLTTDFGDARVANRVVSKTGWQGALTSAVNTEVTFVNVNSVDKTLVIYISKLSGTSSKTTDNTFKVRTNIYFVWVGVSTTIPNALHDVVKLGFGK